MESDRFENRELFFICGSRLSYLVGELTLLEKRTAVSAEGLFCLQLDCRSGLVRVVQEFCQRAAGRDLLLASLPSVVFRCDL